MPDKYCLIDDHNKKHLTVLINFLIDEVFSAGGDGDGLWYSQFFRSEDIIKLMIEGNLIPRGWTIQNDGSTYTIGEYQESLTISNDETVYTNAPSWQQILIKY